MMQLTDRQYFLAVVQEALEKLPVRKRCRLEKMAVKEHHEIFFEADLPATVALIQLWSSWLELQYQQFRSHSWLGEVSIINPTLCWFLDSEAEIIQIEVTLFHEGESSNMPWGWGMVCRRSAERFHVCMTTTDYLKDQVDFLQRLANTSPSELNEVFRDDPTVFSFDEKSVQVSHEDERGGIYFIDTDEEKRE